MKRFSFKYLKFILYILTIPFIWLSYFFLLMLLIRQDDSLQGNSILIYICLLFLAILMFVLFKIKMNSYSDIIIPLIHIINLIIYNIATGIIFKSSVILIAICIYKITVYFVEAKKRRWEI